MIKKKIKYSTSKKYIEIAFENFKKYTMLYKLYIKHIFSEFTLLINPLIVKKILTRIYYSSCFSLSYF